MTDELHRASARSLAQRVQSRKASALKVAQTICACIAKLEPPRLNAFADFDPDVPLAAAHARHPAPLVGQPAVDDAAALA